MQGGVPMDIDLKIFNILTDEQKEAVMTGDPCEASQYLHFGNIVAIDLH